MAFLTSPLHTWAMPPWEVTRKPIPASTFCVHSGFAYIQSRFCCSPLWVFCNVCCFLHTGIDHSNWWHCPWRSASSPWHFCSPVQTLMGSCQDDSWTSQSCFSPSPCDSTWLVNFFFPKILSFTVLWSLQLRPSGTLISFSQFFPFFVNNRSAEHPP